VDIRERLLAGTARVKREGSAEVTLVDPGAFVRRLLLFEHYIVDSIRLEEIPTLTRVFGIDGVIKLLESGIVSIRADPLTFGQTGQLNISEARAKKGLLPLGSYAFSTVEMADHRRFIHDCLQEIKREFGEGKKVIKLKRAIVEHLVPRPPNLVPRADEQLARELTDNGPQVSQAVALALSERLATDVKPGEFALRIHPIDERDYRAESDIGERFSLNEHDAHALVERGLLAVGGLSLSLAAMESYEAVTGFRHSELPILESKFSFLLNQFDPDAQEARLDRVIEIAGLPTVDWAAAGGVDAEALLELRDEPEWQAFRQWLRQTESAPDEEIKAQLQAGTEKLARLVHGKPGSVLRFLTVSGASLLGLGKAAELGIGAVDQFIVENLVQRPGPASFLGRLYKSVFPDR
jgi:hypothetical protein